MIRPALISLLEIMKRFGKLPGQVHSLRIDWGSAVGLGR